MMDAETWRVAPGYETLEVSDLGRARNARTGKLLKIAHRGTGMGSDLVCIPELGKPVQRSLPRLVALAFLGAPPDDAYEASHRNRNKHDNRAENLEWVTRSELRGRDSRSVGVLVADVNGSVVGMYGSQVEAARRHYMSRSYVSSLCRRADRWDGFADGGLRFIPDESNEAAYLLAKSQGVKPQNFGLGGQVLARTRKRCIGIYGEGIA